MEEDFTAHRADEDTLATWKVIQGQLEMYSPESQEEEERQLENDMDKIAEFLIEKETITGKEFMDIFHKVQGIGEEVNESDLETLPEAEFEEE